MLYANNFLYADGHFKHADTCCAGRPTPRQPSAYTYTDDFVGCADVFEAVYI
jgi:prepilin-type processing-associated H-X9-DG protein